MKRAMEKHAAGRTSVIPVIVRPCDWQRPPLKDLLAAPKDGKPITTWANYDEAYADVARKVREVVGRSGKKRSPVDEQALNRQTTGISNALNVTASLPRSSNLSSAVSSRKPTRTNTCTTRLNSWPSSSKVRCKSCSRRHPEIEARFRRVDADKFVATIYQNGKKESECAVNLGGAFRQGGISSSRDPSSRGNSFNELVSVRAMTRCSSRAHGGLLAR